METWLPVAGYEEFYKVSDLGRIWSLRRDKPLVQRVRKDGRLNVDLYDGKGGKLAVLVHRLVLTTHVAPCPDGMESCHWDDNPKNNALANLYWGTRPQNCSDRKRNGRYDFTVGTHCVNGHEFTPENTWLSPKVRGRSCRQCRRDNCTRSYRKRRANAIQSRTS